MNVICVLASPRDPSNSSALALRAAEGARENGHEVKIYRLNEMNVRGCQGCGYCKQNSADCKVKDDLSGYWKELHACGALILAAPNYAAYPCGPMITYMNRHYCLIDKNWKPRIKPGIKLIGVFAQGNTDRNMYMPHYEWLLADFQNRGMVLTDTIVHTRPDSLDAGGELMTRAYNAGKRL